MGAPAMTLLIPDAGRVLFTNLIDYAGLFPPASLDIDTAVAEYRRVRSGGDAWIAGRFLCSASRLDDLATALVMTMRHGEEPWRIGVICDGDAGSCASTARAFHLQMDPAASVEVIETRLPPETTSETVQELLTAAGAVNDRAISFFEVPATESGGADMIDSVYSVAAARDITGRTCGAKLRCGGATPQHVPDPDRVALFIDAATRAELPFKFTAGLHHPLIGRDHASGVVRHGFLNLEVAAAVARAGAGLDQIEAAISDADPAAFDVSFAGLRWRGHDFPGALLAEVRARGFVAFGSCDFDELVAELYEMGFVTP